MARRKKNDDEPKENQDNINNESDDTFGLPEVEYEPLKRDQAEPPAEVPPPVEEPVANTEVVEEPVYEKPYERSEEVVENVYKEETVNHEEENHYHSSYHYEPEKPSPLPKILLGALLLLLAVGAVYYFAYYQPKVAKEAQRIQQERERVELAQAEKKRKAELADKIRRDAEQKRADSLAAIPKVGTIEVLSGRTGQYYIVVASAVDDDLLNDYAVNLTKQGKSVKVIPPFGKTGKFYRLAVDSKDTYADAQAAADGMKGGDFGDQLWVVKY
jgi:hypothetical protein